MAEAGDLDSEAEEHTGEEDASDIKSMNATAAADGDDDDEASTMSGDPVEIASEDIGDNSVLDSDHDEDNPEPRTKRRRVNPEPVDTVPSATQGQSLQNKERLTAVAMGYPSNPAERLEAATDHISTLLRTANRARHALGRNLVPVTNQDGEFPPRALSPIDSAMVLRTLLASSSTSGLHSMTTPPPTRSVAAGVSHSTLASHMVSTPLTQGTSLQVVTLPALLVLRSTATRLTECVQRWCAL